jgi:hypothetical protein
VSTACRSTLSNVEKLEGAESFKAIWLLRHKDKGGMTALESPKLSLNGKDRESA